MNGIVFSQEQLKDENDSTFSQTGFARCATPWLEERSTLHDLEFSASAVIGDYLHCHIFLLLTPKNGILRDTLQSLQCFSGCDSHKPTHNAK